METARQRRQILNDAKERNIHLHMRCTDAKRESTHHKKIKYYPQKSSYIVSSPRTRTASDLLAISFPRAKHRA